MRFHSLQCSNMSVYCLGFPDEKRGVHKSLCIKKNLHICLLTIYIPFFCLPELSAPHFLFPTGGNFLAEIRPTSHPPYQELFLCTNHHSAITKDTVTNLRLCKQNKQLKFLPSMDQQLTTLHSKEKGMWMKIYSRLLD